MARDVFLPDGSGWLECAAFALLMALVMAAPFLPSLGPTTRRAVGGGVAMPVGTLMLEVTAFAAAAATFLARGARPASVPAVSLGGVFALALLGVIQLVPLPEAVLERIAPTNLEIYHETDQILRDFGRKAPTPRVSIAPTDTFGIVLLILAYVALFFSAASLLRTRPRRRAFSTVLLTAAGTQILVALIRESAEERLRGAFVNPDQLAGYLEISLAFAFGLIWTEVLTSSDRGHEALDRAERFEKRFVSLAARTVLWGIIAVGIALTQSRGGILAAAVTTLVLLLMAAARRRLGSPRRAAADVTVAVVGGVLLVAVTAGAAPFVRFLQLDPRHLGSNPRVAIWRTSLRAWRDFPLLGSGLGTFREAFRRAQPRGISDLVEHAHSDSLQLLVTGGTIGAALGVVVFVSLLVLLVRAWQRQRHREESAFVLAGFGVLLSLTLHGFVDFNLSIPAITGTLVCALGGAWAAGANR